jgi:hypothetical protein
MVIAIRFGRTSKLQEFGFGSDTDQGVGEHLAGLAGERVPSVDEKEWLLE